LSIRKWPDLLLISNVCGINRTISRRHQRIEDTHRPGEPRFLLLLAIGMVQRNSQCVLPSPTLPN